MKRTSGIFAILLLSISCMAWQWPGFKKPPKVTSRTLTGSVLNKADQPVSSAVVYLKNTKTLAIKTFISGDDGKYRFPELSLNIDYEVHAEKAGVKSNTKTLSQFDDRPSPILNLRLDTDK